MSNTTWMTTKQVSEFFAVHQRTVMRWTEQGRITAYRVGPKNIRFRRNEIEALGVAIAPACETVHEALIEEKIGDIRDVYLIRGSVTGHIKIGVATNVLERLRGIQTGSSERLDLVAVIPNAGEKEERRLHRACADQRIVGEWFRPSAYINSLIDSYSIKNSDKYCGVTE